jgi:primosomal replication protein N
MTSTRATFSALEHHNPQGENEGQSLMICDVPERLAAFSFGMKSQEVIRNIDIGSQIAKNTSETAKKLTFLQFK